jgi:hypothetical protein
MNSVIDVGWANFLQARNSNLRKSRDQRQSGSKSSTSTGTIHAKRKLLQGLKPGSMVADVEHF